MKMLQFLIAIVLEIGIGHLDYVNAHHRTTIKDNLFIDPLDEFTNHNIIKPQLFHGKHKTAIKNTLIEENGLHHSHIILSYHHNGENVVADLHLNEDILPQEHFLRFQDSNRGSDIIKKFTKTEIDLCHYQGNIRGKQNSIIAISTCNGGINGIVLDGLDTYFIHSTPDGQINDKHFIFRHSDIKKNATCGYKDENDVENLLRENSANLIGEINNLNDISHHQSINSNITNNRILRYKRSSESEIHGPYNANKYSSFVELVLVVDNKVYQSFGENIKKVHNHCKDLANIVNALYVPLNIFIALVGVVVWSEANEIVLSEDGDVTLKNFLQYRRTKLVIDHPNDNAQLLTKEQFSGGVVGKALKGPICTYEYSGGVSMEHSPIVGVVATTVAHEMGHNFGMEHDTADCKCEDEKCIMSASSTSVVPRHWSSCSKDQLNVAFSRGMNYCLRNKPVKLFDSPQCGNGFVEVGEQCDCGLPKYCQNTCCDPNTCMLYANASCATGECCDLTTCRPKAAGFKCRSAQSECDLPEYCTGDGEYCPTDVYKRDTTECDSGNAFCYQGTCRSRTAQCKILWGPSGQSSDYCYDKNVDGSRHGNCGFDRLNNRYIQCNKEDVRCGMLHCKHLNERLEFGMESVAVLSHSFMNHKGNIIPCRTAVVDLGLESIDPGLTPNGAKCGDSKMCVNQKCVSIEHFRVQGKGQACPEDCNGNGVCNSKGNCHCFIGFGGPYCSSPGFGGSNDSGPATNPSGNIGFTRTMYIFFLGVVPFVSIFLFLMYYWKQNKSFDGLRKSANVLKPVIKMNPSRNDGSGSPNSPCGGMATSSPSSTDDMNSALLRSPTENNTANLKFGKYKGFTLAPLPNAATNHEGPKVAFVHPVTKISTAVDEITTTGGAPIRHAPPVPKQSPLVSREKNSPIITKSSTLDRRKSPPNTLDKKSSTLKYNEKFDAPALPPPNPGFNARPLISSPVLETSTCTAKEISNDRVLIPARPAPIAPPILNNMDSNKFQIKPKDGTIKRIASFLKKDEKNDAPYKVRPKIDRERLKTIEISAPISVDETLSSVVVKKDEDGNKLNRTQSMRSPKTEKPSYNIEPSYLQTVGSMRSVNRPKSIVGNNRPKSPPPRPPAPTTSTYNVPRPNQLGHITNENEYDDCEAVEPSLSSNNVTEYNTPADEIYSVIDEYSPPVPSITNKNPKKDISLLQNDTTDNNSSMGLLGEIVNEIEKRNVDSIYSASTLKKSKSIETPTIASYMNNSTIQDNTDTEQSKTNTVNNSSNINNRNLNINNAPVARVAPNRSAELSKITPTNSSGSYGANSFSSFKQVKPNPKPGIVSSTVSNIKANTQNSPNSSTQSKPTSVTKRSPSPSTAIKNTSVKPANKGKTIPSPKPVRKTSVGENKTTSDVGVTKQNSINSIQKPKVSSKPPGISTVNKSNLSGRNLSKQNSIPSSVDNTTKIASGTKLQTFAPTLNRNNSSAKNGDNLDSNNSTNNSSSNNSNNKIGSTNKPVPGKTVSSLQQKFENSNKIKPENSSSSTFKNISK